MGIFFDPQGMKILINWAVWHGGGGRRALFLVDFQGWGSQML